MELPPRTITLEEHVALPSLAGWTELDAYVAVTRAFPKTAVTLTDCSEGRIAAMNSAQVSLQVLSHIPNIGISDVAGCRGANNEMAEAVKKNPHRFAGFAVLPMTYPEEAAKELERAVTELGFCGALIDNSLDDMTHYDGERFWPFWATAERLGVPIYLHPKYPPQDVIQSRFAGNYGPGATSGFASALWGWHENVGLHFLKLCAAGVFDRFPKLKIILGHMGEMVPFMLDRIERMPFLKSEKNLRKTPRQAWADNIWITTSGMFSLEPLATVLKTTKVERILYSIDYPFEDISLGPKFIEELARSGVVTKEELDMIAYKNAEALLGLEGVLASS
ncbi:hypothetical protein SLS62_007773 [Diatrype stigma]|uniref:Amidohydrolase-related domain-containing protein n=1 Tax=Diatrype stigma TaxID=117547 RepID=A0AAN9UNM8_9PEZI